MIKEYLPLAKKTALVVLALIWAYIYISFLVEKPATKENTIKIKGHFVAIQKVSAKGSISYNLYIKERDEYYKIAADNSDCFEYDNFRTATKEGQSVEIFIKENVLWSPRVPMVVCLVSQDNVYLSFDCVNEQMQSDKIIVPIMSLIALIILSFVIYQKEVKLWYKTRMK